MDTKKSEGKMAKKAKPAKPSKPDAIEIKAEIAALVNMKPFVRRMSMFGDDHHAAIDAQIKVLQKRWEPDEASDEYSDEHEYPENVCTAAYDAAKWLAGQWETSDFDGATCPSESWKSLVTK
jgi:hypothetical protein